MMMDGGNQFSLDGEMVWLNNKKNINTHTCLGYTTVYKYMYLFIGFIKIIIINQLYLF